MNIPLLQDRYKAIYINRWSFIFSPVIFCDSIGNYIIFKFIWTIHTIIDESML